MILDDAGICDLLPFIISIVVVSKSGHPVVGATISSADRSGKYDGDTNGHYRFLSWQEPPIEITVAHHLYEPAMLMVTDPAKPCIVNLHETCM